MNINFVVFSICILILGNSVVADILYQESVSGDLSNNNTMPTFLGALEVGSNTVSGSLNESQTLAEPDYWTVTVLPGHFLQNVILRQQNPVERSFLGIEFGNQITDPFGGNNLAGGVILQTQPEASVGDDLLDNLAIPLFIGPGSSTPGFDLPLSAGNYTFWFQEASTPQTAVSYEFDFIVSVPEPGASSLSIAATLLLAARRKRT